MTSTSVAAVAANDLWNALVKTALLGTDRTPLPEMQVDGSVQPLLAQIDVSNKEKALLSAAVLLSIHRSCGKLPQKAIAGRVNPAEPESLPLCSSSAATYLGRLLKGEFTFVLPEFLDALIASARRVPEELLPEALEAGRKDTKIRANLAKVVGRRGEWLASLNEDWQYLGERIDAAEWETSSRPSRVALLKSLRASDPGSALNLVQSTWSEDSPDDRIAFINELQAGLRPEDEVFLDAALEDRRREVRRKAADLLAHLPTSRLAERMKDRARGLINIASGSRLKRVLIRESSIEVRLPEACDASMQRDGIESAPPQGKGEKAWWLGQIVAAVPICFWNNHLKLTPSECISEATKTDYGDLFLSAWSTATKRAKDSDWASALFDHALQGKDKKDIQLLGVIEAVPEALRDKLVCKLLKSDSAFFGPAQAGMSLLQSCSGPWSDSLGRAFLDLLRYEVDQSLEAKPGVVTIWLPNPEQFAMKMPVTLATHAQEGWPENLSQIVCKPIQTFLAVLEFRSTMLKEIGK